MTKQSGASSAAVSRSVVRLAVGALPVEALAVLAWPVGEAVVQAAGYAGRALPENTKPPYASNWQAFCLWCEPGGVGALPAARVVIAGPTSPTWPWRWGGAGRAVGSPFAA